MVKLIYNYLKKRIDKEIARMEKCVRIHYNRDYYVTNKRVEEAIVEFEERKRHMRETKCPFKEDELGCSCDDCRHYFKGEIKYEMPKFVKREPSYYSIEDSFLASLIGLIFTNITEEKFTIVGYDEGWYDIHIPKCKLWNK